MRMGTASGRAEPRDGRAAEELAASNEELQAQAEELAASNERLRAQTLELQAAYEELQAQSEELMANNEELQVQAEEVHAANEELQVTIGALRESEERYRGLVEVSPDAVFVNCDNRIVYLNPAAVRLFGASCAGQILGMSPFDLFHPEFHAALSERVRRLLTGERAPLVEAQIIRLDGTVRDVEVAACPFQDGSGLAIQVVARDVTVRKQAQQAVLDRESELRLLMDSTPILIAYVGADGRYGRVNRSYEDWFACSADEVQGRGVREMLGEAAWEIARPYVERALAGEQVAFEQEVPYRCAGKRWVHATYTPDRDEHGHVRGFAVHVVDIAERKRAEEGQARLGAILEAAPDLVGLTDSEGRLLNLNRAGRRLLGLGETEEIAGTHVRRFHPPAAFEILSTQAVPAAVRDGAWTGETLLLTRDGREIPVSQAILAHKAQDGSLAFLSTIVRDISEQKRLESELRQSQKMEAVGRLAGGVAHDFNNLLTPIMAYSQLLCDALDADSRGHGYAVEIASAAERAAGLPRQLLAFSRREMVQPRVLDLNETITEIERMLRRLIGEDVLLTVLPGLGLGQVKADPGQMEQVLLNLAVNARDAMPGGGALTIETANAELDETYARRFVGVAPGRYVVLMVSDTGCGMDRETLSRVFEPFFTTKDPGKGTGLGLSTVYGIVRQNDGQVRVSSAPGRGSTFRVYLPRVDEPSEHAVAAPGRGSAPRGSEVVLLAEDDAAVRDAARLVLESHGYTLVVASSGEEGLRAAERFPGPIHLLLTDVVMPGISGRQLSDRLTAVRPSTRTLFMSGYTEDAIMHHGVLEDGLAFLQKPFTPHVLLHKVREVLDAGLGDKVSG